MDTPPSIYLVVCSEQYWTERDVLIRLKALGVEKYVIGHERGKKGYRHMQIRYKLANDSTLEHQMYIWEKCIGHMSNILTYDFKSNPVFTQAHVEPAQDVWWYERKEGRFLASDDIGRIKHANLRSWQRQLLRAVDKQNDRQVHVVVDTKGGSGKTFLCKYLLSRGKSVYVPPALATADKLMGWVHSSADREPYLSYVIVDIPRGLGSGQKALWTAIETVKDGITYDWRYNASMKLHDGLKVIVFCNEQPNKGYLSDDRWILCTPEDFAGPSL